MVDFQWYLNRQGVQGNKGDKGDKGDNGNTPTFYTGVNTGTAYTLIIDSGDGNTFETENLMPTFVNTGGTYLRLDTVNSRYVAANADMADLQGTIGEVKLATTDSVQDESVRDTDAVSYELFNATMSDVNTSINGKQDTLVAGTNITLVDNGDGTTTINSSGGGGGGGGSYTAGNAINISDDTISVKYDNSTIKLDGSGKLKADFTGLATTGDLAGKADAVHTHTTSDITDFPNLGTLASKNTVDYSTEVTNKPTIGDGTVSVYQNGTLAGTFTMNQTTDTTINLTGGGGGGGTIYAPGTGIDISAQDVISVKYDSAKGLTADGSGNLGVRVDGSTMDFDSSGNLKCKITPGDTLPSQTGNSGKFLTTDGSATSWATVSVPSYSAGTGIDITSNTISIDTSVVAELSDIPDVSHMVTDDTAQTISAKKTFTDSLVMSGITGIYYKNSSNNETFLIGKTGNAAQGFGKIGVGVINDALELRGSGTRPQYWASGGSATDLALLSDVPDITNMVTTNTTQSISGTKTFSSETHFTGNLTFDSALGTPIIRGMSGSSHRNMITRSNTYSTVTTGNTSDNLILKGALTRPKYSHDSSDGGYLALYSDIPGDMTGAAAGTAGTHGLVPAPAAGDNEKFLRGDGTWQTVSGGGTSTDVRINGTSITESNIADIKTQIPVMYNEDANPVLNNSDIRKYNGYIVDTSFYPGLMLGNGDYRIDNSEAIRSNAVNDNNLIYAECELIHGVNLSASLVNTSNPTAKGCYAWVLGKYSSTTFIPIAWLFYGSYTNNKINLKFYPNADVNITTGDLQIYQQFDGGDVMVYFSMNQSSETSLTLAHCYELNNTIYGNKSTITLTSECGAALAQATHIRAYPVAGYDNQYYTYLQDNLKIITSPNDVTDGNAAARYSLINKSANLFDSSENGLTLNYNEETLEINSKNELSVKQTLADGVGIEINNKKVNIVQTNSFNISNPKFNTVGSVSVDTITGIASNFSDTDYLTLNNPLNTTMTSFEIVTAIKLSSLSSGGIIDSGFKNGTGSNSIRLTTDSNNRIRFRVSQLGKETYNPDITGTTILTANTKYYIKITFSTSSGYELFTSADGSTWTSEGSSLVYVRPFYSDDNLWYIGDNTADNLTLPGSVYLFDTYVKVDNEIVWRPYNYCEVAKATNSLYGLVKPDGVSITINDGVISSVGGSSTDVQINGVSIVNNDVANIVTESTYNATTNKIATVSDLPNVNNATVTFTQGGVTKGTLTVNQSGNSTIALDSLNSLDLLSCDVIKDYYVNGASWWILFTNNLLIQGGFKEHTGSDGNKTINLLKSYANTDFLFFRNGKMRNVSGAQSGYFTGYDSKTVSSITYSSSTYCDGYDWLTLGLAASS